MIGISIRMADQKENLLPSVGFLDQNVGELFAQAQRRRQGSGWDGYALVGAHPEYPERIESSHRRWTYAKARVSAFIMTARLGSPLRFRIHQTYDAPDGHRRMQDHCWPQRDSSRLTADANRSKDDDCAEVVENHRGDQSSRGATVGVMTAQPASGAGRDGIANGCRRRL